MNAEAIPTKDLLEFFFHCSDSMQTFWNFYITVVLGAVAVFASIRLPTRLLARVITTAFIVFAIVNLDGLHDVTHQRLQAANQVKRNAAPREKGGQDDLLAQLFTKTLNPPEFWEVVTVHITVDVSTIAVIWLLTLRKTKAHMNELPNHSLATGEFHGQSAPFV